MARITVEREHSLGKQGARAKADTLAQKLNDKYGVESSWSGDTLNLKRSGVKGTVEVDDDSLRINVELGLLMSAMSGTLKSEIEKALDKALA
ncbi:MULTISPECIES: polyhydroxyalkanoic acid system family protein [Pseudomonas]|uniref:Polyhydroxyalkanoic acid system protein n=1 Tax=Pseudomonas poae TaxID=200451 RepID=A0AAP2RXS9_9PSED|nr:MULTISPECIES: polyhydroxyalkanoic acid system family protein [Pseudomonas]KTC40887.1 polyhydroxyalkanoic acid system protein [Pseudomonas sp. ABAC21]AGE28618.1 polyhydroxyalkanoic acid system protein [Pseudomonas poae RE*1-1-14]KRP52612.1 polyhydroxyalkanoic acid system protein [Pseudomonas poae]MCF5653818.1 polyhydroxyalkanoic acid system protein [Pseudomonas poae]MCF5778688.1 polyhydroxyalkanoic acid system protein [Pseudomonas poae]